MNEWLKQALQFVKEAYVELRKVTWLTRKEVIASTIVVLILVCVIALFVGAADFVLARLLAVVL